MFDVAVFGRHRFANTTSVELERTLGWKWSGDVRRTENGWWRSFCSWASRGLETHNDLLRVLWKSLANKKARGSVIRLVADTGPSNGKGCDSRGNMHESKTFGEVGQLAFL